MSVMTLAHEIARRQEATAAKTDGEPTGRVAKTEIGSVYGTTHTVITSRLGRHRYQTEVWGGQYDGQIVAVDNEIDAKHHHVRIVSSLLFGVDPFEEPLTYEEEI